MNLSDDGGDAVYRLSGATTWRDLDGEVVALDTDSSTYFSIGGYGRVLWLRLVDGATRQDLIDHVVTENTDVTGERAAADIDEFIASCLDEGLIVETAIP